MLFLIDSKYQQSKTISLPPVVCQGGAGDRADQLSSAARLNMHQDKANVTEGARLKGKSFSHQRCSLALYSISASQRGRKQKGTQTVIPFCATEQNVSVPHPLATFHFQRDPYSQRLEMSARHGFKSPKSPFFSADHG